MKGTRSSPNVNAMRWAGVANTCVRRRLRRTRRDFGLVRLSGLVERVGVTERVGITERVVALGQNTAEGPDGRAAWAALRLGEYAAGRLRRDARLSAPWTAWAPQRAQRSGPSRLHRARFATTTTVRYHDRVVQGLLVHAARPVR